MPEPDSLATEELGMWLALFGIVIVMSLGFGIGSVLADMMERDSIY